MHTASDGPVVVGDPDALRSVLGRCRADGATIALVPTMGALHAGHAALFDAAGKAADVVVASVFVNPLQFGPGEDLARYPRTFEADMALAAEHGVDVVFAPDVDVIYPHGEPLVHVDPGPLGRVLEGATRPGHFRGVLTVVAKLFGIVRPAIGVFGEKDYQQLVLIRSMAAELCLGVQVAGVATVREPDGLAESSRNRYLDPEQRSLATTLHRALRGGQEAAAGGPAAVVAAAADVLAAEPAIVVDYLVVRSRELGEPPVAGEARLLVAARIGSTRLIDNIAVHLAPSTSAGDPP